MSEYIWHPEPLWPQELKEADSESRMSYFDSVKLGHPIAAEVKREVLSYVLKKYW